MQRVADNYLRIITIIFVAGAAFLSARLASELVARSLWSPKNQAVRLDRDRAPSTLPDRLVDFQVIQDRNLFNDNPPPPGSPTPTVPGAAAAAQPAPLPTFDYLLAATAVISDGKAFALFTKGEEMLFGRLGKEIAPGVVLSNVKKDRVEVTLGKEKKEILLFTEKNQGRSGPPTRPYQPAPVPQPMAVPGAPASDTIKQLDANSWAVDKREVDQAMANLNQLITQIRVIPVLVDGKPQGFTVANIAPGSLFTKIGLQDGDVIKEVNGVALTGIEVGYQALTSLQNQTSIQVTVLRRNQPLTLSYEIR